MHQTPHGGNISFTFEGYKAMQKMSRILAAMAVLAPALLLVTGCVPGGAGVPGAAGGSSMRNDLKILALAYHNHHDANGTGPADLEACLAFVSSAEEKAAIQRVVDAGYNITWGKRFRDLSDGMSNTVLAQSPSGGPVVMFDGSVQ